PTGSCYRMPVGLARLDPPYAYADRTPFTGSWVSGPVAALLRRALEAGDLVDAAGVPAALEGGVQPDAHHALPQLLVEQVGRQPHSVGVVVRAASLGGDAVGAGGGADAVDLVRRDAHADAGAADQDAALHLPVTDRPRHLEGVVGVVDAVPGLRAD